MLVVVIAMHSIINEKWKIKYQLGSKFSMHNNNFVNYSDGLKSNR